MPQRRYDLDWLRISAFGLLILYHVGMFYVSWDWHVKSSRASETIEPLMLLVNPWRLTLLFLISGAATRFIADKMGPLQLTASRMARLWPPLLLAVFVIVPPQSYYEIVEAIAAMPAHEAGAYAGALDNFYPRYATGSGNWCDAEGCLITPTYNHMWFVAYLILYTLALILLLPVLRRMPKAISVLIAGPGLFLTPWLFLFATRITLYPIFGQTHFFADDWYLHTIYFAVFLFGFAIAKHQAFFDACVRWRWFALVATLTAWGALLAYYEFSADEPADWLVALFRGVREAQAWTAILAAIGFAHRHLRNADGPVRRVLTEAIFPFYLVHQTIIVVAGHHLDALGLPLALEAALLLGAAGLGCWLFYDLARRVPLLRPWAGLRSKPAENRDKNAHMLAGEAQ
jgi:peptidoglycan/LPS O-acetylase OafA/YrhL